MNTLIGPGFARGPGRRPPVRLCEPSTSVMDIAMTAGRFELHPSGTGSFRFVLKAGNGQIIGQSEMYSSAAGMENGILSVARNAPEAELKDLSAS